MENGYRCETMLDPTHILSISLDSEFEMLMDKCVGNRFRYHICCKECYKKVLGKKKIVFKSKNLYVYSKVKV